MLLNPLVSTVTQRLEQVRLSIQPIAEGLFGERDLRECAAAPRQPIRTTELVEGRRIPSRPPEANTFSNERFGRSRGRDAQRERQNHHGMINASLVPTSGSGGGLRRRCFFIFFLRVG